jgi:hypothetical protein
MEKELTTVEAVRRYGHGGAFYRGLAADGQVKARISRTGGRRGSSPSNSHVLVQPALPQELDSLLIGL